MMTLRVLNLYCFFTSCKHCHYVSWVTKLVILVQIIESNNIIIRSLQVITNIGWQPWIVPRPWIFWHCYKRTSCWCISVTYMLTINISNNLFSVRFSSCVSVLIKHLWDTDLRNSETIEIWVSKSQGKATLISPFVLVF